MTLSVPGGGFSRNTSCAINKILVCTFVSVHLNIFYIFSQYNHLGKKIFQLDVILKWDHSRTTPLNCGSIGQVILDIRRQLNGRKITSHVSDHVSWKSLRSQWTQPSWKDDWAARYNFEMRPLNDHHIQEQFYWTSDFRCETNDSWMVTNFYPRSLSMWAEKHYVLSKYNHLGKKICQSDITLKWTTHSILRFVCLWFYVLGFFSLYLLVDITILWISDWMLPCYNLDK